MIKRCVLILIGASLLLLTACSGQNELDNVPVGPTATVSSLFTAPDESAAEPTPDSLLADEYPTAIPDTNQINTEVLVIDIDVAQSRRPISQDIYGVSGNNSNGNAELRPTLESWGGNPSTRFNWRLGNAWNTGADWFYNNVNYNLEGNVFHQFLEDKMARDMSIRVAVPTMGWVAKNSDPATCSFPDENGECTDGQASDCENQRVVAEPTSVSVASTPADIVAWINEMHEMGAYPDYIAMDNEPELWGYTHYDMHPDCTSYSEILEKYIEYSTAIRDVAPDSQLTGPVTCCWWYYWNSAAGAVDKISHGNADFLPWFLRNMAAHDAEAGQRHLDVLDIHYYPEGLYNDEADNLTAAHRLRATRSLWDWQYVDESWINEPIALIPLMLGLIDDYYPGTFLGISEWNFGADDTMNGALAIADVLGIFGREGVTMAAYWRILEADTPGNFAFRMFTNYDGDGGRFGDLSVLAFSPDPDIVSSFAAIDTATDSLHLILINKQPSIDQAVQLNLSNFTPNGEVSLYRYDKNNPDTISSQPVENLNALTLPAYSITHLVISGSSQE